MKLISIIALFFSLVAVGTALVEPQRQGKSESSVANDIGKRGTKKMDLLSQISCRYLKINGYFNKIPSLKKLCLATFYCRDLLSQKSCNIIKKRNKCKQDSSLSLNYCKFTCNKCYHCAKIPLGMESRAIPDSNITASSENSVNYAAVNARLNLKKPGKPGAWTPKTKSVREWLKVDLGRVTYVTGVATQGSNVNEWMTSYSLQYSIDGTTYTDYKKVKTFTGNSDKNTVVKHDLQPPINAKYIKFLPKTWHNWPSMRAELYGCS